MCDNRNVQASSTSLLADFRAGLPDGIEAIAEPIGWTCAGCGSSMTLPDALPASEVKRRSVVEMLTDAARHHVSSGCDASTSV